jgi:hypothetical protein
MARPANLSLRDGRELKMRATELVQNYLVIVYDPAMRRLVVLNTPVVVVLLIAGR